jgi:hypothetical protein
MVLGMACLGLGVAAATIWGALAIYYSNLPGERLRLGLAAAFVLGTLGAFLLLPSWRLALVVFGAAFAVLLLWWAAIEPSNARDWQTEVAVLPYATQDGDLVTLHNVRNFDYRTEQDFVPRYDDRTFDLDKLDAIDLITVYWAGDAIAHVMVSFGFGGDHVAISIETRKEKGEEYSAIRGFFRQFELYYVVADERDVIGVRASERGEQVFLYRIDMAPENARKLLLRYLDEVDALAATPKWYNALTHNCTTEIRWNLEAIGLRNPFDWRILANGHLDELMYERKAIDQSLPFDELRAKSDVTLRAIEADGAPDFSRRIRVGVPGM